ncbi:MAG TPA: DUF4340 domain-containing protein [Chryseolinea sp.]|nr:DUF4340 domain-containing protein [Chryseolinea sp.]
MQAKKNKLLAALLLMLLVLTTAAFLVKRTNSHDSTDKDLFRDFDLKTISRIILASPAGRVELSFTGSRWKVNNEYAADPSMIEVLFATLQQAEPKRPIGSSQQDSLSANLQNQGVKVSLFNGENIVKSFYAGGNTRKNQAYFMADDRSVPYVMTIPGYRVYVSGIFELDEGAWRDKHIFAFNWRNFHELDASFAGAAGNDFKVVMMDNLFTVAGLQTVDTTRLNDFLDNVSLLTADAFAQSTPQLDSLGKTKPLVSIVVKDVAKKEYKLDLYPKVGPTENFPGLIDGTQWAYFHKNTIEGVIRPRSFFGK